MSPAGSRSKLDPRVRAVLRLYFDAVMLAEPAQLALWHSHRLTLTQFGALRELQDASLPAGRLAARLGVSATSLTRMLDRLESRGLVERTRDASDRRRIAVRLLPAGLRLHDAISVLVGTPIHWAVEHMTEAERQALVDALGRLLQLAREREGRLAEASPADQLAADG